MASPDIALNRLLKKTEQAISTPGYAGQGNKYVAVHSPIAHKKKKKTKSKQKRSSNPQADDALSPALRASRPDLFPKPSQATRLDFGSPMTSGPNTARSAEIVAMGANTIPDEVKLEAKALVKNPRKLARLLQKDDFLEACMRAGVPPFELRPQSYESFRFEPNSAIVVSPKKQSRRFRSFEQRRVHKMGLVLLELGEHGVDKQMQKHRDENIDTQMQMALEKKLAFERDRVDRINDARHRSWAVLNMERDLMEQRRQQFDDRAADMAQRLHNVSKKRAKQQAMLQQRARANQQRIQHVQEQGEQRMEEKVRAAMERFEARDKRVAAYMAQKEEERRKTQEAVKKRTQYIKQVRESAVSLRQSVREERVTRMTQRLARVETLQARRAAAIEAQREEKMLREQDRLELVQRQRRQEEYRKQRLTEAQKSWSARVSLMNELRKAIVVERRHKQKQDLIEEHARRSELEAGESCPGPGAYSVPSRWGDRGGGRFNLSNPKSDVDWTIYRGKNMPGPGSYSPQLPDHSPGVNFGTATALSATEMAIARASETPGPAAYEPKAIPTGAAVVFNKYNSKSDLELKIEAAKQLPGPGDYTNTCNTIGANKPARSLAELKQVFADGVLRVSTPIHAERMHRTRTALANSIAKQRRQERRGHGSPNAARMGSPVRRHPKGKSSSGSGGGKKKRKKKRGRGKAGAASRSLVGGSEGMMFPSASAPNL